MLMFIFVKTLFQQEQNILEETIMKHDFTQYFDKNPNPALKTYLFSPIIYVGFRLL